MRSTAKHYHFLTMTVLPEFPLAHLTDTLYVKTNFAAFLLCTAKTLDKNKQPKQGASAKRKFVGYSSDSSSDSSDDLGSSKC
jgi:hypothetical protein